MGHNLFRLFVSLLVCLFSFNPRRSPTSPTLTTCAVDEMWFVRSFVCLLACLFAFNPRSSPTSPILTTCPVVDRWTATPTCWKRTSWTSCRAWTPSVYRWNESCNTVCPTSTGRSTTTCWSCWSSFSPLPQQSPTPPPLTLHVLPAPSPGLRRQPQLPGRQGQGRPRRHLPVRRQKAGRARKNSEPCVCVYASVRDLYFLNNYFFPALHFYFFPWEEHCVRLNWLWLAWLVALTSWATRPQKPQGLLGTGRREGRGYGGGGSIPIATLSPPEWLLHSDGQWWEPF